MTRTIIVPGAVTVQACGEHITLAPFVPNPVDNPALAAWIIANVDGARYGDETEAPAPEAPKPETAKASRKSTDVTGSARPGDPSNGDG